MLPSPMGTEPNEPDTAPECSDRGLGVVLVLAGLLPFLGMLLAGVWNEREIALGGMLLLLAFSGAVSTFRSRRRSRRLSRGAC